MGGGVDTARQTGNDGKARVTALQKLPRSYALLGELNNRPRVQYLARIKNPNPALTPAQAPKTEQG